MKNSEREPEIIRLWLERPEDKRTWNHLQVFEQWLRDNRSDLLPVGSATPYSMLGSILRHHIREQP